MNNLYADDFSLDSVAMTTDDHSYSVIFNLLEDIQCLKEEIDRLNNNSTDQLHTDDIAVSKFASMMQQKLAKKREEGYAGWNDKDQCTEEFLHQLLCNHIAKGDPVDVANVAMMLAMRGEKTSIVDHDAQLLENFRLYAIDQLKINDPATSLNRIVGDFLHQLHLTEQESN